MPNTIKAKFPSLLYQQFTRKNICKGFARLSKEQIITTLTYLGLSKTESEIYLYLTVKGHRKAGDIAEELNLPKHQVYNSLKRLRKKGIVNASFEQVTTFSAQPFKKIIDSCIRKKLQEAENIGKKREEILSDWRLMMTEKDLKGR
jgi:sugar-specific transcriptional regulator TrmB